MTVEAHLAPGPLADAFAARLAALDEVSFGVRLWRKDPSLWGGDETTPGLADRLGWLDLPVSMEETVDDLATFSAEIAAEGVRHVLLLGMGGSSLAPEVFQRTLGNAADHPEVRVADSTHPGTVRRIENELDLDHTLFVVSSKSGTTTETVSLYRHFRRRIEARGEKAGPRFVAVTDPGSALSREGRASGFRRVFEAPPDVGGRYSALTPFGLVPAALQGADLVRLLESAVSMGQACGPEVAAAMNPGIALGVLLGEAALAGRPHLTLLTGSSFHAFPDWVEQLVAESTGKEGQGIVPVVHEPLDAVASSAAGRIYVATVLAGDRDEKAVRAKLAELEAAGHPVVLIVCSEPTDLTGEMFRWEVATAVAGAVLGINPFDQPDVELAKRLSRRVLAGEPAGEGEEAARVGVGDRQALEGALRAWLDAPEARYVTLQAFLGPDAVAADGVVRLRDLVARATGLPTIVGWGPRYLHSTGQLHKGGPPTGLFLQLFDDPDDELDVPGTDYSFAHLVRSQAEGDAAALASRGRRLLRLDLGRDVAGGLARAAEVLASLGDDS